MQFVFVIVKQKLRMCLPERVAILKCYSIKTCVQSGWQICIVTEESYACVCCQEGATNALSSFIKKNACIGESGYPVLVAMVQIRLYCSQGGGGMSCAM